METSENERMLKHYEDQVRGAVKGLFEAQDLLNIAPDIVSACYAVDRDDSYEDDTKVKILVTFIDLMANLISISEKYKDFKAYERELKQVESK